MKDTGMLQLGFLPGLSGMQETFTKNEWVFGGLILLLFFFLLLVWYVGSRVFHRFQLKRKMAGPAGENHPAIPAVFYESPIMPELPDPPDVEIEVTEEGPGDPEGSDIRGDPEDYSSFSQLDNIF